MALEINTKEDLFKIIEEQNQKIASLEEKLATTSNESETQDDNETTEETEEMSDKEIDELDKFLNK